MKVMIIEDDFRIAKIHQEMVEELEFCTVIHAALNAKDALDFLARKNEQPDIILLDIFIPDTEGLNLLERLRAEYPYINIIIASAADDAETVLAAKKLGVYDYLLKPIEKNRLKQSFIRFQETLDNTAETYTQAMLDQLFQQNSSKEKSARPSKMALPKGIDKLTLDEIIALLDTTNESHVTTQTLVENIGVSRSTARRYLEYLDAIDLVQATLHYGQVGRPQRLYLIREQNGQN